MESLLRELGELRKGPVRKTVDARLREFRELGRGSAEDIFSELCFCLMTANCSAERCVRAQEEIDTGFMTLPEPELKRKIRELVCRFYNSKTEYVMLARKKSQELVRMLREQGRDGPRGKEARDWLVKNIKGLGLKEASHFLRNIGYGDVAIIDFHIVDLLERRGIVKRPKSMMRKTYLDIERKLGEIAERAGMNLAELDLYLWYLETGKVLK